MTSSARATTRRLDGIDVARALAIVGMVAIHVSASFLGPVRAGDSSGLLIDLSYGRASTLFAFVAGIGITLGSRRGTFGENAARLLWRASWLLPVGVVLGLLGTPIAVILQYYALWFVLAIPFLRAPTWLVAVVASVGVLIGPTWKVWAEVSRPAWFDAADQLPWIVAVPVDVVLTGSYPTVSWIWVVLVGMAVARLDLADRAVAGAVTAVGAGVAMVAYRLAAVLDSSIDLGVYEPWFSTIGHADTPLEQIAVTGVAAAVTGVCLLLASVAGPVPAPLAALGRLALSVYVGHIVVYAVARDLMLATSVADAVTTTMWVAVVSALFAVGWLQVFRRGPLEALDRAGYEHLVRPLVRPPAVGAGAGR